MRGGLSTIQQTLTPEAATVLNHSIAEAGRRNHGQTTPLHVAATLLAAPSGFLRQACIRSHPNSSHPLQCRALELCFSVALDRLPTAQNAASEPSISNALMAALKRAQAHQRRGCPEQQQQPLLAVKVELEQLIVSILDDPSVSRVMREASFSSPAVKATIEQSLNVNPTTNTPAGIGFRPPIPMIPILPNRNTSYLNPRFQQQQQNQQYQKGADPPVQSSSADLVLSSDRNTTTSSYLNPRLQQGNSGEQRAADEVQRVIEILLKTKKRNPILVGETEPESIVKEILRKIDKGELSEEKLKNVQVISIEQEFSLSPDKNQIPAKIKELGTLIEARIGNPDCGGIIIDLSDLKWLVDQPAPASLRVPQQVVSESGKEAVAEMGRLMAKFGGESGSSKVWLIGTATCETYLRCQVYHPSMEADWDLQALPITARSPLPRMFSRLGSTNGILSSSVESLNPLKNLGTGTGGTLPKRLLENVDSARSSSPPCCPKCCTGYEQELAKLVDNHRLSSDEVAVKSDTSGSPLPRWLQNAKSQSGQVKGTDTSKIKDQELVLKQKTQELQRRWSETCSRLHPNHQNQGCERREPPVTSICNPNLVMMQPKLQLHRTVTLQEPLQVNQNRETNHLSEPPRSPVRTDLVLGSKGDGDRDLPVKDLLGCISSEPVDRFLLEFQKGKFASASDADLFKKLLRALMKKAWWQPEAASSVANTITQCKFGEGNRLGGGLGSKNGSIWLLFTGPDRVGKKKMAYVLAEHVCGANPIMICLGSRRDEEEQLDLNRGKTALDRIVEAVRRNPFSVIMLMDIDEADMLVRGNIKRAMERGRIADSYGREISLGNVIFILTGNWSTANIDEHLVDEQRLRSVASSEWNLRLTVGEKRTAKRRADWLLNKDRRGATKPRIEDTGFGSCLSLDLNQAADAEDDRADGSVNSSDLTTDQEDSHIQFSVTSVPHELVSPSHGVIVFKPANFNLICREIEKTITKAFSAVVDDKLVIEVEESTLESILGGLWFGRTGLEEWAEQVLVPSFHRLKARLPTSSSPDENLVVRLELDWKQNPVSHRDWLPSQIAITGVVDGE